LPGKHSGLLRLTQKMRIPEDGEKPVPKPVSMSDR